MWIGLRGKIILIVIPTYQHSIILRSFFSLNWETILTAIYCDLKMTSLDTYRLQEAYCSLLWTWAKVQHSPLVFQTSSMMIILYFVLELTRPKCSTQIRTMNCLSRYRTYHQRGYSENVGKLHKFCTSVCCFGFFCHDNLFTGRDWAGVRHFFIWNGSGFELIVILVGSAGLEYLFEC